MHVMQRITDQLTLVCLDVRIWSGRKKLRAEDLKLGTEMPPEELVSLGSKRVCNPEALRVFHRLKKAAERACLLVGTRFLGGFAVAAEHAEAVADKLDALKSEFDAETSAFLSGYNEALEDWITSPGRADRGGAVQRRIRTGHAPGGRPEDGSPWGGAVGDPAWTDIERPGRCRRTGCPVAGNRAENARDRVCDVLRGRVGCRLWDGPVRDGHHGRRPRTVGCGGCHGCDRPSP